MEEYKGSGTVNEGGNYGLMVSVIDEANAPSQDVDLFRMATWNIDAGSGVYDNQTCSYTDDAAKPCTAIARRNTRIHRD